MKTKELLNFYKIQHKIFGLCPHTKEFFRLSECHIYTTKKPDQDWLQKIEAKRNGVRLLMERFYEKETLKLNIIGQKQANKIIRKIDKIFTPNKLDPNDSFGIFDPIDFVIFDGMEKGNIKRVVLLDSYKKHTERKLQNSIKDVIRQKKYKFSTFRINNMGKITEE